MYKPKLKLLRDHGTTKDRFKKFKKKLGLPIGPFPFCIKFKRNNKQLYYIASRHTSDKKSRIYKLISNVISKRKPDIILLEGILYKFGLSPNLTNKFESEIFQAERMARKYKIPFIGVEPDKMYIINKLIKMKIKKEDILLTIILQNYKVLLRNNTSKEDFYSDFTHLVKYHDKYFDTSKFNFDKQFEKSLGYKFSYGETDTEIAAPYKNGVITQKIANEMNIIRDTSIIKFIYEMINKYDKVLIVIGQNHLYSHYEILKKTFGKPKIVRL